MTIKTSQAVKKATKVTVSRRKKAVPMPQSSSPMVQRNAHVAVAPDTGAARSASGRALDARPDRLDLRDLPYRPPLRSLPPIWPAIHDVARFLGGYISAGLVRDQGSEGACTGFGLACVANYLLWVRSQEIGAKQPFESVSPRMIYELARRYDEWPGVDYEGSSCRGALKGWNKHGVCSESLWPFPVSTGQPTFQAPRDGWQTDAVTRPLGVYYRVDKSSIVDVQAAIANIGAVYASATAHDGWDGLLTPKPGPVPKTHAALPVIGPMQDSKSQGGHAFALVGYDNRGFIVQNSWGERWGARGFAIIPYEEWIVSVTDVWVCALGVPIAVSAERLALSSFKVPPGQALVTRSRDTKNPNNPPDDPWPIDHPYENPDYMPVGTAEAYRHSLVSGNEGVLLPSDVTFGIGTDPARYAKSVVVDGPLSWLDRRPRGRVRLMIYAHGGLNSEEESIQRTRVLLPYALANDVYPLFLAWKTGPLETLADIFEDYFGKRTDLGLARSEGLLDSIREGADLMIEAASHRVLRGVWSEMRENAERSATVGGRAIDLLAQNLIDLRKRLDKVGAALEIHLVGHSAGSILLGWLLDRLLKADLANSGTKIASCSLLAPACSVQFAVGTYGRAGEAGLLDLSALHLYNLSDRNELADGMPIDGLHLYGKSLLYLVSRALDDERRMPLLGLQRAIDPKLYIPREWSTNQAAAVQEWRRIWTTHGGSGHVVETSSILTSKTGKMAPATHGSFDNNAPLMQEVIARARGSQLVAPIEWLDY